MNGTQVINLYPFRKSSSFLGGLHDVDYHVWENLPMNRILSIALLIVLVIAPMFPLFLVPRSDDAYHFVAEIPNDSVELEKTQSTIDTSLQSIMFFTGTPNSKNGFHFVCKRGIENIAYFGISQVRYYSEGHEFTLEFPGSNRVEPVAEAHTSSTTNYIIGNEPSRWRTGIQDFAILRYSEIYPGIDLLYKIQDGNLKYEFIVSPNANPDCIRLQYVDADCVEYLDDSLVISKGDACIKDTALHVYQNSDQSEVRCDFSLENENRIRFELGEYDVSKPLVIDPILLVYSTFIGGGNKDSIYSVAVEDGYIYVTGDTYSWDFSLMNAYDDTFNGSIDAFVVKFAPDGQSIIYSTFLGGSGNDYGLDIAVENGYAYFVGHTSSTDYPTYNAINSTFNGGPSDAVITKLSLDGQSLNYSSYIGGDDNDKFEGIAVENGFAYAAGSTYSANYPHIASWDPTYTGMGDAVVTKFTQDGQSFVFSTFLGNTGNDAALGIDVENGISYVTGSTSSSAFYTSASPFDDTYNGVSDVFLTIYASDGMGLYSTFIGGDSSDKGHDIVVKDGYAYIVGQTGSTDFPTINAFDAIGEGDIDCFVLKMDKSGLVLSYSTYLGSSKVDVGWGIALDDGCAVVTGWTWDIDFPTYDALYATHNGGISDAFVTKLSNDGQSLVFSTYLGGSDDDYGRGIAVENGSIFVGGTTGSVDYPVIDAFNSTPDGSNDDCFLSILSSDSDMDSLSDWHEGILGTDKYCIDSDNDNFLDGYEYEYGSNPADPLDYPAMPQDWYDEIFEALDGNEAQIQVLIALVSDNTEFLNSLNASLYLLNGTYREDYDNVTEALDEIRGVLEELGVTVGDSDYDGLDDLEELEYGTDLLCIDTDTDNLNDAFEVKIGTDPLDDDSDADSYLDGIEVIAGSDPLDPQSFPGSSEDMDPLILVLAIGGIGVVVIIILSKKLRGRN